MAHMSVSVVLPAYNEAENLPNVLSRIHEILGALAWDYELIVVDDGSTDNTAQVLAGTDSQQLTVVRHEKNKGYGAALKSGFQRASKEWVFFMDSDGQFDIGEIERLAVFCGAYEMIIGYRAHRRDNNIRLLNAWLFTLAVRMLFGLNVYDPDCAFKLIRRSVIERARLEADGALINTELLVRAKKFGAKIKQVPVHHYPRTKGSSTGGNIKVIARAMKEIILLRLTGHVRGRKSGFN